MDEPKAPETIDELRAMLSDAGVYLALSSEEPELWTQSILLIPSDRPTAVLGLVVEDPRSAFPNGATRLMLVQGDLPFDVVCSFADRAVAILIDEADGQPHGDWLDLGDGARMLYGVTGSDPRRHPSSG